MSPTENMQVANSNDSSPLNPLWTDEFLDFSEKRGSHRRSMSDSVAFLDIPLMAEEEECRRRSSINGKVFDKFDDDQEQQQQFMSMFKDELMGSSSGGPNMSCSSNQSSPSNFKNMNVDDDDDDKETPSDQQLHMQQQIMKSETEGDSNDKIIDPKRIKRILANRQSAQRSRVRKMQYVSELERSVTSLQAEISALSPRVAYLDHQRLILGVDNSVLKQRIAALAQDKIFKDAHEDALKREIERLRQVYYQQNHNKKEPSHTVKGFAEKEQLVN